MRCYVNYKSGSLKIGKSLIGSQTGHLVPHGDTGGDYGLVKTLLFRTFGPEGRRGRMGEEDWGHAMEEKKKCSNKE